MKTKIKNLIKVLQMFDPELEIDLQEAGRCFWNSRFFQNDIFKCERCKKEIDKSLLQHNQELTESLFDIDKLYEKIVNNHFSHFLRVEKGIDGIENICPGCEIDLIEEFEKFETEQDGEIGFKEE